MKNLSIQDKVNKILAIDTESKESNSNKYFQDTGKESNKMKSLNIGKKSKESNSILNLKKNQDTAKTLKELKNKKSIIEKESELTLQKLDRIDTLSANINSLNESYNILLNNFNESIEIINRFNSKLDNLENLILNSHKNDKSILNGINSFHAKLMESNKPDKSFYKPEKESNKPDTVLRKGKAKNKPIESDSNDLSINDIFGIFQNHFNNKNFMGDNELTEKSLPIFMDIMQSIDISNIDSINKSLADIISRYRKEKVYFIAPKSTNDFKQAIIETIKELDSDNENLSYEKSESNKPAIDKAYFSNKFNCTIKQIENIINDSIQYGKIDNELIEAITEYFQSNDTDINDNDMGLFINYIKAYMES